MIFNSDTQFEHNAENRVTFLMDSLPYSLIDKLVETLVV